MNTTKNKDILKKGPTKLLLLILITVAMIEFYSLSFITYKMLNKMNSDERTIRALLTKLIGYNLIMIILFVVIVFLVTRTFNKINGYAFFSCTTGLPNKNFVLNNLIGEISRIKEFSALITLDMDNFKAVNDNLGHLSGDELLRQAGRRFKKVIELQDCVCHIGGDEFLFFIKSAKNKAEIEEIAKALIDVFKKPFGIYEENVDYVTASLGIALIPEDGKDFQTIYNCADDAMYSAKNSGKNSYKFYDKSMSFHIYEESIKKKEIEEGIKNKEFKLYYQPKISNNGRLVGAEALVRWFKSDGKIIPPSEFIGFSERKGLIIPISELVIDQVFNKVLFWIRRGYKDFTISINITAEHLINEELCKEIIKKAKSINIPPQYIEFEITESMIIKDFKAALSNIKIMREFGFKISMDDFGTGYSSLNYFKTMPIDIIKIDKSFIDKINEEQKDRILIENIISLSHSFNYKVVAEGVESIEQYEILKNMKCDIFQGYYFEKPIDENTFEMNFLKKSITLIS